jgi:hypothetical protein
LLLDLAGVTTGTGREMTALHVLLGLVQIAIGVVMITRRDRLPLRTSAYGVASRRGLLLILGVMLTFVGVVQIAEAFV